ncbi:hypothetical protein [Haloferula sp.]|uniref:hypothetical protein n=1 Tax=Haloferula sp. TaxID=2497595 RepID=UPI00329BF8CB
MPNSTPTSGNRRIPALLITPLLFGLAWLVSRLFRLGWPQTSAVIFELPCRNTALAMLISLSILGRRDIVSGMMGFFAVESLIILLLAGYMNRVWKRKAAA